MRVLEDLLKSTATCLPGFTWWFPLGACSGATSEGAFGMGGPFVFGFFSFF